jgi:hypothetical protein
MTLFEIAHDHGYNAIFAGYGFMAEDEHNGRVDGGVPVLTLLALALARCGRPA